MASRRKRRIVFALIAVPVFLVYYLGSSYLLMYGVGRGWIEMHETKGVAAGLYVTPIQIYCRFDLPGGRVLNSWLHSARDAGARRREFEPNGRR